MKWLAINAVLQKIFKQKKPWNPNLHLMTTFSPIKLHFFASLKFLTLPMGLKESPSQKSVKPRVTFSCFKASFLWLSRALWLELWFSGHFSEVKKICFVFWKFTNSFWFSRYFLLLFLFWLARCCLGCLAADFQLLMLCKIFWFAKSRNFDIALLVIFCKCLSRQQQRLGAILLALWLH